MANNINSKSNPKLPLVYQIQVEGRLGDQWSDWFECESITPDENGSTLLTCTVTDQAALHGLLKRIRNLGIPLLSVNRVLPDQPDP